MSRIPSPRDHKASKIRPGNFNPRSSYISFSFSLFKDTENFGFDCQPPLTQNWIGAFVEALRSLSELTVKDLEDNGRTKEKSHFHKIPWGDANVYFSKEEFYRRFIPQKYEADDYEIYQFSISKANGRIIGFFDEDKTFKVVLIDAKHNFHLSIHSGKRLDLQHERIAKTEHELALDRISHITKIVNENCKCGFASKYSDVLTDRYIKHHKDTILRLSDFLTDEETETFFEMPWERKNEHLLELFADFSEKIALYCASSPRIE
ncbi:hypothetical protein [Leptospira wolffii]|uniref:hypothetical protein n=1 Tax=Leptospira wolffii TaxID=409998 RepID=UPI0002FFA608|nr:hypothetical protein [Leptospira wolffii]EPG66091.1 hypothetical protein LEP1GSC061_2214 [Leptospira wolffii serovar Khorat str. Khorat-H2]